MSIIGNLKEWWASRAVKQADTAGPVYLAEHDDWNVDTKGYWAGAILKPAHPGRVGGPITPKTLVVHTTDMCDCSGESGQFNALVKAWTSSATNGACAHFLVGRSEEQGVVQFVSVNRNGNHAGGPVRDGKAMHGWYVVNGKNVHPNTVAVGIEVHAGGLLKRTASGRWQHADTKKIVPAGEVYVDQRNRGWQMITPYQLTVVEALIKALKLPGLPVGSTILPDGDYKANGVDYYAPVTNPRIAIHATLDPVNKTDCGPQLADWLRGRGHMR